MDSNSGSIGVVYGGLCTNNQELIDMFDYMEHIRKTDELRYKFLQAFSRVFVGICDIDMMNFAWERAANLVTTTGYSLEEIVRINIEFWENIILHSSPKPSFPEREIFYELESYSIRYSDIEIERRLSSVQKNCMEAMKAHHSRNAADQWKRSPPFKKPRLSRKILRKK